MKVTLLRRIAAILYDGILLSSVLFFATLMILPLISDTAIESGNLVYNLYLLIMAYLYFCWQWINGGQTLGMKSWRIKLISTDGKRPGWKQVSLRFIVSLLSWALCGAGFLWSLFDKNRLTLHDHLSSTRLVIQEKDQNFSAAS